MDPDSKRVRVTVTDGRGRPVRDGGLAAWLAQVAPGRGARRRRRRARQRRAHARAQSRYRAQGRSDRRPLVPGGCGRAAGTTRSSLGDIVIATGVARRQARDAGHSLQTELRVLALHGLLHLLGYDHHDPDDNGRMARLESRLRRRGGLRPA